MSAFVHQTTHKSENERCGVLSTAMSFLGLYRDPSVAEVTKRCDWRITDLVDAPRRRDRVLPLAALRFV